MSDDTIHIYDPVGLNEEMTLDDMMENLMAVAHTLCINLIHNTEQMDEINALLEPDADKELKRIVSRLQMSREFRLPSSDAIKNIEKLQDRNPIASPLLHEVIQQIRLFNMGQNIKSFRIKPILVVGKPGIGKTYTIQRIAECLGLESFKIDISMGNEAFFLSGSQRGYANTTPGEVALKLSNCMTPNPICILDELDKGVFGDQNRQPMTGPLLALLERETSEKFYDTSLRLNIDTSYISWMATANDISKIPAPVLSRFLVVEFNEPTPEHMKNILRSVATQLLKERCLTHLFIDASTEFLIESVKYTGRELKHVIDGAIARYADDIQDHYTVKLEVIDLKRFSKKQEKRSIGFIQ